MARKSKSKPATRRASSDERSERERIIDAFMALLAEKSIEQIGFAEIAKGAGVSLSELRGAFGSTFAILAAFVKQIDRALARGQRWSGLLDELCRIPAFACRMRSRRRRADDIDEETAAV